MNSPLAEALQLTRSMLAAARAGDWAQVGQLQERRAPLLQPGLYTHADAQALLPELHAAQRELAATIGAAHADVRRHLLSAQRANAAANAYLDTARD